MAPKRRIPARSTTPAKLRSTPATAEPPPIAATTPPPSTLASEGPSPPAEATPVTASSPKAEPDRAAALEEALPMPASTPPTGAAAEEGRSPTFVKSPVSVSPSPSSVPPAAAAEEVQQLQLRSDLTPAGAVEPEKLPPQGKVRKVIKKVVVKKKVSVRASAEPKVASAESAEVAKETPAAVAVASKAASADVAVPKVATEAVVSATVVAPKVEPAYVPVAEMASGSAPAQPTAVPTVIEVAEGAKETLATVAVASKAELADVAELKVSSEAAVTAPKVASAEMVVAEQAMADAPVALKVEPGSVPVLDVASGLAAALPTLVPMVAAAGETSGKKFRKVIKKVVVKKLVPKVTTASKKATASKAAAPLASPLTAKPDPPKSADNSHTQSVVLAETPKAVSGVNKEDGQHGKKTTLDSGKKGAVVKNDEASLLELPKRKKAEVFIGGLHRDTVEEDVRRAFSGIGEISEVRVMMDPDTGKCKGYSFVRFKEVEHAKEALRLGQVQIRGKLCGVEAAGGRETLHLQNIDKTWKEEDITKLLHKIGIHNTERVTLVADPGKPGCNRGSAFIELETYKDAQLAFKKLTQKDPFGKGLHVIVSWAANGTNEQAMEKVKSVYVEGIPLSWDRNEVSEAFKIYGSIERVVLARNIRDAKRKDFAYVNYATREAAVKCVESFDKDKLKQGIKVNITVSLAKPAQQKNMLLSSVREKDATKTSKIERKVTAASSKRTAPVTNQRAIENRTSTNHELLHVLREQALWRSEPKIYSSGYAGRDYDPRLPGGKRTFSSLADPVVPDIRGYPRARVESVYPLSSSSRAAGPAVESGVYPLSSSLSTAGPSHSSDGYYGRYAPYRSPGVSYHSGARYEASHPDIAQRYLSDRPYGSPRDRPYGTSPYARYY